MLVAELGRRAEEVGAQLQAIKLQEAEAQRELAHRRRTSRSRGLTRPR